MSERDGIVDETKLKSCLGSGCATILNDELNFREFAVSHYKHIQHNMLFNRHLRAVFHSRLFSSNNKSAFKEVPNKSFHKRPLPQSLIALNSTEGKALFKEAMELGGMESYFALSEQFITQSEPEYCSLSSLAMVLNALNYDPKRVWKGAWRWVSEEMLQCESTNLCCHSIEKVRTNGMDFSEFESLARCHGVIIESHRVQPQHESSNFESLQAFKQLLQKVSSSDKAESFIVVNFSRKVLDQTGSGHFSPIGGYHHHKDLVLIMDVARFKYPPYWVSTDRLWLSMQEQDKGTGMSRGYFRIAINTSNDDASTGLAESIGTMPSNDLDASSTHLPLCSEGLGPVNGVGTVTINTRYITSSHSCLNNNSQTLCSNKRTHQ